MTALWYNQLSKAAAISSLPYNLNTSLTPNSNILVCWVLTTPELTTCSILATIVSLIKSGANTSISVVLNNPTDTISSKLFVVIVSMLKLSLSLLGRNVKSPRLKLASFIVWVGFSVGSVIPRV